MRSFRRAGRPAPRGAPANSPARYPAPARGRRYARRPLAERDERQHAAVTIAALRAKSDGLTQRLADRGDDVTLLADQLAQARRQFEHFLEKAAEQRQSDPRNSTKYYILK